MAFYIFYGESNNKRNIESLKDKHKGQRCFIICNGPSLTPSDLTKIHESGDITIGMNLIGRIYDKTPWRVTYLSATDDICFRGSNNHIVKQTECEVKFYDKKRYLYSIGASCKKMFLSFDESFGLLDNPKFDPDMTKKIPSIGTSTYFCLELAVYLGCSEIYIVGCDMSYKVNLNRDGTVTYNEAGKDHFYKNEEEAAASCPMKPLPTWQQKDALAAAAVFSKERGYNIMNATRGGALESFPRVDFDSLF